MYIKKESKKVYLTLIKNKKFIKQVNVVFT
jgi:hypothetical protein